MAAGSTEAGVIRDDVADSEYLSLGAQPQYSAVGRLTWSEPAGGFLGSGTLITENWVLTAAHNLDGSDGAGGDVSNVSFSLGGVTYGTDQWIIEPTWAALGGEAQTDIYTEGWDLALVRLSEPVLDIAPAKLYTGVDELGQIGTMVGYGATGVGSTGFDESTAGTKRAGQNVIDVVGETKSAGSSLFAFNVDNDRLLGVDFDAPGVPRSSRLGERTPLDLEYLIAPGDSGGGLFFDVEDQTYLAGVTSFGQSLDNNGANSDYGDYGGFTRVSPLVDWIVETVSAIDGDSFPHSGAAGGVGGDFNGDGTVDENDYLIWQEQYGQSGEVLTADGNGDGVVDGADYTVWRDNAGSSFGSPGTAFAIPEPSSAILHIMGIGGALRARSRRSI